MQTTMTLSVFVPKEKEDFYFELPFDVPQGVSRIDLRYDYQRHSTLRHPDGGAREEINIIDLALCAPGGEYLGSSGADRDQISVSEAYASPGYAAVRTVAGRWSIIVGGARVHSDGVLVTYEIAFTHRERVLLRGDLHAHTIGSDGYLNMDELADMARRNGLDFLFYTDHNNFDQNGYIRPRPDITLIPGMEWTHFKGHIGMLGVRRPFRGPFYENDIEGVNRKLREARENGALTVINHPFLSGTAFRFGLENVSGYDCVEVWNGPFVPDMRMCVDWWQRRLALGERIPAVGGGDFHQEEPGRFVGAPSTFVYAQSNNPSDILEALRRGNSFISFCARGPRCQILAGDAIMGDVLDGVRQTVEISIEDAQPGDILRIITDRGQEALEVPAGRASWRLERPAEGLFVRVELHRAYLAGDAPRLAMLSNPLYFRAAHQSEQGT